MKRVLRHLWSEPRRLLQLPRELEKTLINQGRILAKINEQERYEKLCAYEFKVFSQWGEDGIIQHLIACLPDIENTFIEFGVENFSESNCRFLMMKDNWSGYVIDGSFDHIKEIRENDYYWRHDLTAVNAFITRDNIADLLRGSGFGFEPGILSVDIDGNDYFVLEALTEWRPSIIIVEFNGLLGWDQPLSIPYDPGFIRTQRHFSNLYWGANLPAFYALLSGRGYKLLGVNSVGSNAFFVRQDQLTPALRAVTVNECRRPVTFREGRDRRGRLMYQAESERINAIAHLPIMNTSSGEITTLSNLGSATLGKRAATR